MKGSNCDSDFEEIRSLAWLIQPLATLGAKGCRTRRVTTVDNVLGALDDPSRKVADVLRLCLQLPPDLVHPEFLLWAVSTDI